MDSPGQGRRKESLTSSITEGTSKFFNSMMAKKNGLMSDISSLSSKIESTFMPTASVSSSESDGSIEATRSAGAVNKNETNVKATSSANTKISNTSASNAGVLKKGRVKPPRPPPARQESIDAYIASQRDKYGDTHADIPMNAHMSFDCPLYNYPSRKSRDLTMNNESRIASESFNEKRDGERTKKCFRETVSVDERSKRDHFGRDAKIDRSDDDLTRVKNIKDYFPGENSRDNVNKADNTGKPASLSTFGKGEAREVNGEGSDATTTQKPQQLPRSSPTEFHEKRDADTQKATDVSEPGKSDESPSTSAPSFQTHRRRSSTVDEMLFDDYVETDPVPPPTEVNEDFPAVTKKLIAMGNLISFDDEYGVHHAGNKSRRIVENDKLLRSANEEERIKARDGDGILVPQKVSQKQIDAADMLSSSMDDDSSDVEYGGTQVRRSASFDSDRSWSSNFSTDSQPDGETRECMAFMKNFIESIFNNQIEAITQTDKALFGRLIQDAVGRLWFARYINSKRVNSKCVDEQIFFRLVQYFSLVLFECDDSDDFSPAKTLMSMCFTFYHESPLPDGRTSKQFLYTFLQQQPIWQSLRFWNAAFFDAVQTERARRPVCTSSDGSDIRTDDREFQENITFGQLGTFTCNMRAFGLRRDLCLEFLRKQSVIANLSKDKMGLLRESIEKLSD